MKGLDHMLLKIKNKNSTELINLKDVSYIDKSKDFMFLILNCGAKKDYVLSEIEYEIINSKIGNQIQKIFKG